MALAVASVYGASLAKWFGASHSPREFVFVGQLFIERSDTSQVIKQGPVRPTSWTGFDGQFFYYIAMDPREAVHSMDLPGYRYQRIAYPLLARLLVLGRPSLIPDGLLAFNLLAVVAGTAALAGWLMRRGVTPWVAAVWGLLPGQVFAIEKDLSEASAYAWVAVGLWVRDRFPILAGAVFGLAGLTRETTLIFPAVLLAADVFALRGERRVQPWLRALLAAGLAAGPFVAWKLFLWHWLGHADLPLGEAFTVIPFGGFITYHAAHELVPAVLLPALVCTAAAAWALWRRYWRVEVALLLVNLAVLIVFSSGQVYVWWPSVLRMELGFALAAVMLLAVLPTQRWFWLAAGLWLWLTPILLLHPV
ncbi:MAG: hypothetical protein DLM67_01885 [Candidatus Nephthysia bennettiae]|uniref:DUF2029 domain-containing protein n=1 Tax=Candidatus Nephthysia bennettiae TaxID=3127016 RepID=A0A934K5X1_9BACT|nr:hypothetical protein [Candidatus Dormibacteraeota bacterium]MBJ7611574.1 hypothetical protein [Candidatus Dormibacteraeota bacterium]PZS00293.1 MAG: hypothetical protein DLM67_01885 [Candidatus Dormibacteraeota bacterium]